MCFQGMFNFHNYLSPMFAAVCGCNFKSGNLPTTTRSHQIYLKDFLRVLLNALLKSSVINGWIIVRDEKRKIVKCKN